MGKLTRIITASVFTVVAATMLLNTNTAEAQSNDCSVRPVDETVVGVGKNLDVDGTTITARFEVVGNQNCTQDVTLATWDTVTDSIHPIEEQVLYDHATGNFGVGRHTLTANLPVCSTDPTVTTYWQADLLRGTNPTTADGDADYAKEPGRLMDWELGGEECPAPVYECTSMTWAFDEGSNTKGTFTITSEVTGTKILNYVINQGTGDDPIIVETDQNQITVEYEYPDETATYETAARVRTEAGRSERGGCETTVEITETPTPTPPQPPEPPQPPQPEPPQVKGKTLPNTGPASVLIQASALGSLAAGMQSLRNRTRRK